MKYDITIARTQQRGPSETRCDVDASTVNRNRETDEEQRSSKRMGTETANQTTDKRHRKPDERRAPLASPRARALQLLRALKRRRRRR